MEPYQAVLAVSQDGWKGRRGRCTRRGLLWMVMPVRGLAMAFVDSESLTLWGLNGDQPAEVVESVRRRPRLRRT